MNANIVCIFIVKLLGLEVSITLKIIFNYKKIVVIVINIFFSLSA